jgi:hypothetical protein
MADVIRRRIRFQSSCGSCSRRYVLVGGVARCHPFLQKSTGFVVMTLGVYRAGQHKPILKHRCALDGVASSPVASAFLRGGTSFHGDPGMLVVSLALLSVVKHSIFTIAVLIPGVRGQS